MQLNQITLQCQQLATSIAFYQKLGLRLIVKNDHYARFECPQGESTISLEKAAGEVKAGTVSIYFECENLDAKVSALKQQGFAIADAEDKPWLWREAWLKDPDGHPVCFFFAG